MKKMIVFGTILFLLFEVLYFQSNEAVFNMESENSNQVYRLAFHDEKDDFLTQYKEIVLEDEENALLVLTNPSVIQEIQEKYHITIEK